MSATYNKRDGFVYWDKDLDGFQESIISSVFDTQVDDDEWEIKELIKEEKLLRRVCLFKILTFIPEYILSRILLGSETAHFKKQSGKLYWDYYRKKISLETFKKELTHMLNHGNII